MYSLKILSSLAVQALRWRPSSCFEQLEQLGDLPMICDLFDSTNTQPAAYIEFYLPETTSYCSPSQINNKMIIYIETGRPQAGCNFVTFFQITWAYWSCQRIQMQLLKPGYLLDEADKERRTRNCANDSFPR